MTSRVEITTNALKHGQTVLAGGVQYRVEYGLDNFLYLVRVSDNAIVARARGQNDLRWEIEKLERRAAA